MKREERIVEERIILRSGGLKRLWKRWTNQQIGVFFYTVLKSSESCSATFFSPLEQGLIFFNPSEPRGSLDCELESFKSEVEPICLGSFGLPQSLPAHM